MTVTVDDARRAARQLGLSGRPLRVHSSLRSFGPVAGRPRAVIDGLLAEGRSVMAPSFTSRFQIAPSPGMRPPRNGWDYAVPFPPGDLSDRIYTPDSTEIDPDMGAIPAVLTRTTGRVRGSHPLDPFTAIGPLTHDLIAAQTPWNVYAPPRAVAEAGGAFVLMGVGLNRLTALHLAEQMAGRNPFVRWALEPDGRPIEVLVGGCSEGFPSLDPVLVPLAAELQVGSSRWRAFPAAETLAAAARAIHEQPAITHRGDPACARRDDAVAGGPLLDHGHRGARPKGCRT